MTMNNPPTILPPYHLRKSEFPSNDGASPFLMQNFMNDLHQNNDKGILIMFDGDFIVMNIH